MNEEKLWRNDYLQQSFTYLTEENLDWIEQHCEKNNNNYNRKHIKRTSNGFIHKDKIKEKIAELETKSGGNSYHVQAIINAEKNILKELLEEK